MQCFIETFTQITVFVTLFYRAISTSSGIWRVFLWLKSLKHTYKCKFNSFSSQKTVHIWTNLSDSFQKGKINSVIKFGNRHQFLWGQTSFYASITGLSNLRPKAILCGPQSQKFAELMKIFKPEYTIFWFNNPLLLLLWWSIIVKILQKIYKNPLILLHAARLMTRLTGVWPMVDLSWKALIYFMETVTLCYWGTPKCLKQNLCSKYVNVISCAIGLYIFTTLY